LGNKKDVRPKKIISNAFVLNLKTRINSFSCLLAQYIFKILYFTYRSKCISNRWHSMATNIHNQLKLFCFVPWKCTFIIFEKNNVLLSNLNGQKHIKASQFWWIRVPSQSPFLTELKTGLKYDYLDDIEFFFFSISNFKWWCCKTYKKYHKTFLIVIFNA
jgi:hypothetical protein